jgi:hypothetical protein
MRQLRIQSTSCDNQKILSICQDDYNLFHEEKGSFNPGWTSLNQTIQIYTSSIEQAFQYQTGNQLNTSVYMGEYATYDSGGYVYAYHGRLSDLQTNISELHQLGWIDRQTRAVFIQISLYNPNAQLYTSVILLVEFLSTGGVFPQSHFQPFTLQGCVLLFRLYSNFF